MYEQNVIKKIRAFQILSVAYQWLGEKTKVIACDTQSEKSLLKKLHELLDKAEIVIAHNGDSFDIKKINTRFIIHKFSPTSPYKTIDTKKEAKKIACFDSNKLNELGLDMEEGEKVKHRGFDMWVGCLAGNKKDWAEMKKYNKADVDLLARIYLRLRSWMKTHPNINLYTENIDLTNCRACGSENTRRSGFSYTSRTKRQRFFCNDCRHWF
jgi:uncharacterized protein YprB with RNaseH-like and TPR domain